MAELLFVSKAIAPPWNDSGKNLVRDLARGLTQHRATVMVGDEALPGVRTARVYGQNTGFVPALQDQARVFAYLLSARGYALWHFFFAPNPRSCLAGGLATRLRRIKSVQTISSAPLDARAIVPRLFADLHVVLSEHTEARMLDAGLARDRVLRIAPAIDPLPLVTVDERRRLRAALQLPSDRPLVVYPGDLEFGEGAHLMIEAARRLGPEPLIVMACRSKTSRARAVEQALIAEVAARGLAERVRFVGETSRIHALLACSDVVALPSRDLYAKMDYPLVLLEAMSLERSVIVAAGSAAAELARDDAAVSVCAEAEALTDALRRVLSDAELRARLGSAARASVIAHYGVASMARAYERAYQGLIR